MSKHAFCRAHGICCPALLNSWIKKHSNLAEELSLPSEQESPDMSNRSKEAYKDENAQLKKHGEHNPQFLPAYTRIFDTDITDSIQHETFPMYLTLNVSL